MSDEKITYEDRIHENQAVGIMREIERHQEGLGSVTVTATLFENGREHGYTLRADGKPSREVSFAEHRSSDSIVVYPFPWHDDTAEQMAQRERDWETKTKYFAPYDYAAAAVFVIQYLATGRTPITNANKKRGRR